MTLLLSGSTTESRHYTVEGRPESFTWRLRHTIDVTIASRQRAYRDGHNRPTIVDIIRLPDSVEVTQAHAERAIVAWLATHEEE